MAQAQEREITQQVAEELGKLSLNEILELLPDSLKNNTRARLAYDKVSDCCEGHKLSRAEAVCGCLLVINAELCRMYAIGDINLVRPA